MKDTDSFGHAALVTGADASSTGRKLSIRQISTRGTRDKAPRRFPGSDYGEVLRD